MIDVHRRPLFSVCVPSLTIGGAVLCIVTVAAQQAAGAAEIADALVALRQAPPAAPAVPRAGCRPETFRIALDVGHTPEAPGATSARGVKEHVFNLQLARRIHAVLLDAGFSRTRLITAHGSGRAQLAKRTGEANAAGADLLLSIHHDDVQDAYHETWIYQGAPHAHSERFSGYSLFVSRDNRHFEESLLFARLLGEELAAHGLHYSAHHAEPVRGEGRLLVDVTAGVYRYDDLYVLRFSAAPAVLMEAGIIVNRRDELVLAAPEGQRRVAAAVVAAANAYCLPPSARR